MDKSFNNKARKFFKDWDYDKAILFIDKAIEINPDNADYWYNKGLCLKNLSEYEKAIECFDKAIKINSDKANYWYNKGISLNNLGKNAEDLYKNSALYNLGKYEETIEYYEETILYSLNKYEEAIKCYTKALEINPKKANYWNNKGCSLNSLNKYEEAIKCYDKAKELNPNKVEYLYNKSAALYSSGKPEEAKEWFKKAREMENLNNYIKINLPFEILPSGNLRRNLHEWVYKDPKDKNKCNKRHEISTFLMNFKPDKVVTGLWKEQGDYIIMVFDKNDDERIVIAEAGVYGNATYCYTTDPFDDTDWINVFILDKQNAQDYQGVERIFHHDFEDDLQSWKDKIREKLEE